MISISLFGLAPLSPGIGEGAETHALFATVVTGGLVVSTLLTLIIVRSFTLSSMIWV